MNKLGAVLGIFGLTCLHSTVQGEPTPQVAAINPIIWADVPDIAILRVGESYYMSSTTMHMSPGLPIMKSADLVNWSLVGYAYDTLVDNADMRIETPRAAYGQGSWASSLRFHQGIFYVTTFASTSGRTHIYTTRDIERGPWKETSFSPALHDHSLFFDDDGRVYMIHGGGDLRLTELKPDMTGLQPDGFNEVVIRDASLVAGENVGLPAEGSQMLKHDGKYYVVNIAWPRGGMRTVIIHRADKITGPYEGRVILRDRGIAQGSLIDTPEGKWFAYLFKDNGAVGRIPYLVPMRWVDGWPVLGEDGKVPMTLDIPAGAQGPSGVSDVVASDEFERAPGDHALPLAWQWNHNPDNAHWSLTARPGHLRLTTGRVDAHLLAARNTLTQRTFGPRSVASTKLDVSELKDGDVAGLVALQRRYGYVAVKQVGGERYIIMVGADTDDQPAEVASVPLAGSVVHLRVECNFEPGPELARFFYSLDGLEWIAIGRPSKMSYTLPHFMGYRFGLFCYATRTAGGHADFDYYRVAPFAD
jgi:beta-xylosidase